MKIAVLLTTFNRKDKTIACLNSLYSQNLADSIDLHVLITDDLSTDGTVKAVQERYPLVKIFKGTGSLFWAGGMRNSWSEALKTNPDYYLLLNDDTILENFALSKLLNCCEQRKNVEVISIGSTKDQLTGQVSYGGQKLYNKNSIKSYVIHSNSEYLECDMANANIMLVPKNIVGQIGILSAVFVHSIADFDYTLRAKKAGFKNIVVPGFLGYCTEENGDRWKSMDAPLKERIAFLKSPKGLEYNQYLYFIKQHFPLHFPVAFLKLWLKTLFPVLWEKYKNK